MSEYYIDPEDRERGFSDTDSYKKYRDDALKMLKAGFKSQTHGINPETGETEFAMWPGGIRPGIIDDTLSLASDASQLLGVAINDNKQPLWENSKFIRDAVKRRADLGRVIDDEEGLQPGQAPRGVLQHVASAAGTMAGQLPLPISKVTSVAVKSIPSSVKAITAPLRAVSEFVTPVIDPKISNYLAGTAAGSGLSAGSSAISGEARDRKLAVQDPGAQYSYWLAEQDPNSSDELYQAEVDGRLDDLRLKMQDAAKREIKDRPQVDEMFELFASQF